jgi:hypothetical protein
MPKVDEDYDDDGDDEPRPRRPPPRCCRVTGKRSFQTEIRADRAAVAVTIRNLVADDRPADRRVNHSYQCPHCGFWHTTSRQQ